MEVKTQHGLIWPEFDINSENSIKLRKAKSVEDKNYWSTLREIISHDCDTLPMERFKVWASVMNVPFMSEPRYSEYIRITLSAINANPLYAKAILEPMVGMSEEDYHSRFQVFFDFPTTMNRIQCLSHLIVNGYTPEKLQSMETIIELGAGIGEMADVVYKLGFKGKYIIYDFPEISRIQRWYHNELGHDNVMYTDKAEELVNADLLIATWSLTEMPLDLRHEIMKNVDKTENWLIAYSNHIFGIDNKKYIEEDFLSKFDEGYKKQFIDIPFMPWHGGTKYLSVQKK